MIVLGGGVAANTSLREQLSKRVSEEAPHIKLLLPEVKYTTDNALMIALAAWQEHDLLQPTAELAAQANLRIGAN
ncbi:UGMP family protein [compost metagenome]